MSQSGTKPSFKLEKLKCYVAVKEVAVTYISSSALQCVCEAACRQQIFLMGAVYSFKIIISAIQQNVNLINVWALPMHSSISLALSIMHSCYT